MKLRLLSFMKRRRQDSKKGREDASSLDETSSSTVGEDAAPWRVENILSESPRNTDWWEDVAEAAQAIEARPSMSFDSTELPVVTESVSEDSSYSPPTKKRFRNVGLETWLQVREAWKQPVKEEIVLQPYPSAATRRELRRWLTNYREYKLRRPMALGDMVEIYNEIWNEDEEE